MAIGQSKLHKMLRRARLISDAVAWFEFFDQRTKDEIIQWVQQDQLQEKGVNAANEVIGYYSPFTEMITRGQKEAGEPYNLFDTGAFYRSMYVLVLQDAVIIKGDGDKGNDNLFEKFGTNIINLTDTNKARLRTKLKDYYIGYLRKILLGS